MTQCIHLIYTQEIKPFFCLRSIFVEVTLHALSILLDHILLKKPIPAGWCRVRPPLQQGALLLPGRARRGFLCHVRVYKRSVTFTDSQERRPQRATERASCSVTVTDMHALKAFVNERLAAAAEEIFGAVEKTIAEYKEEISRSKDLEISRLRLQLKLLKSGMFE